MPKVNTRTLTAAQIVSALKENKGAHTPIVWERAMKTRADIAFTVTKRTCAYVRAGIDYANLSSVKEGIESGERGEVQALPWGEWSEFPFIISHKGRNYVRLYPATFANLAAKTTSEYVADGVVITEDDAKRYCLASEFRKRDEPVTCFTIKAADILSIGND